MARMTEHRIQMLLGDRTRINEIDPRIVTRDWGTAGWLVKRPYRVARTFAYETLCEAWRHTAGRAARVERPILMYGVPHWGTSISMHLVARHPDVANLSEANPTLQPPGYFDNAEGSRVRTAEEATPAEIRRLHQRFEFHRWLHRKARLLNKSPNNAVRLDFLHRVFPDACFVHILRDGGCKPPNWRDLLRDDGLEQHALQWREVVRYALKLEEKLGLRVLHVRHEELCADPRGTLERIFHFAGLSVSPATLARIPERMENQNFKARERLTGEQLDRLTALQADVLRRVGYEL
jgi:Sulfotransferase family